MGLQNADEANHASVFIVTAPRKSFSFSPLGAVAVSRLINRPQLGQKSHVELLGFSCIITHRHRHRHRHFSWVGA